MMQGRIYPERTDKSHVFLSSRCKSKSFNRIPLRYDMFRETMDLPGDIIECGVFKGVGVLQWIKFLAIFDPNSNKKVIGFDFFGPFEGSLKDWEKKEAESFVKEASFKGADPNELKTIAREIGCENRIELIEGDACDTIPKYVDDNRGMRISLLHLDFDPYKPTLVALQNFWPLIVRGGIVVLDEYGVRGWGESEAVDDFFLDKREVDIKKYLFPRNRPPP